MASKTETLAKISRIYDLIKEANEIASGLKDFGVECRLGGPSHSDPLCQFARVQISLRTDFETVNSGDNR